MYKERESNFELLRIIAMFLVLVVHADYFSLGAPTAQQCMVNPISSILRIAVESVSIICVNVFVLISGWFGIHFKWKSLASFIFQVFFFGIVIYFFAIAFLDTPLSLKGLASAFQITTWNWFVKSYLLLYILSPVLNEFCNNSNQKTFLTVILCFFVFQTVYGWTGAAKFILQGYSTISFCGLYLLAQYTKRFLIPRLNKTKLIGMGFVVYCVCVLALITFEFLKIRLSIPMPDMFSYVNPIVILSSLLIVLMFSHLKVKSKPINWIASSCFAVFLVHTNENLCIPYFTQFVNHIYEMYDGFYCLFLIFVFLVVVFTASILFDQVRKLIWNFINAHIST